MTLVVSDFSAGLKEHYPIKDTKKSYMCLSHPPSSVAILSSFLSLRLLSQSEQNAKKGEDLDADDEKIGEEDSHFMKLAKKLTAKTLQRKGRFDTRPHEKNPLTCPVMMEQIVY